MRKALILLLCLFHLSAVAQQATNHQLIIIGESDVHTENTPSSLKDIFISIGPEETQKIAKDLKSQGFNKNNIVAVFISPFPGTIQRAELLAQEGLFQKDKITIEKQLVESDGQINERLRAFVDSLSKKFLDGNVVIVTNIPIAQRLIDLISPESERLKLGKPNILSFQREHPPGSEEDIVIQWAEQHLPQTGVLKEDARGFVYLKVDDGYINKLSQFVIDPRYGKPPYFRRPDSPGAHISVIYREERNRTGPIQEIGQTFPFTLMELAHVPPKTGKYLVLQVYSPELEHLRKKYDLSPLLKGHAFHITIAEKN